MYVSLLLDVEDIVAPEADDITRDIARMLTDEGVAATFCVVGERARQWRERRRHDVIEALSAHDIGSHSDLHSVPPTVVQYLERRGWEDGLAEAVRRERPAVDAIREAFGRTPSCWGGPGNSWGPQVNAAMIELGVPAIVYGHTRIPDGDAHRFCGALVYPSGHHVGDSEYHDNAAWQGNLGRLMAALTADVRSGRQWSEVFLGHPSRILHEEFWDGLSFFRGVNTPHELRRLPRRKSASDLRTALGNLRRTIQVIRDSPDVSLRTVGEMNALLGKAQETPLPPAEQEAACGLSEAGVRAMADWVILPPGISIERIWELTRERMPTMRRLLLPG